MKFKQEIKVLPVFISVIMLVTMQPVYAYLGPGAGLSAIGSLLALVAAVLFAIVGFLWFPIKRFLIYRKKKTANNTTTEDDSKVD